MTESTRISLTTEYRLDDMVFCKTVMQASGFIIYVKMDRFGKYVDDCLEDDYLNAVAKGKLRRTIQLYNG